MGGMKMRSRMSNPRFMDRGRALEGGVTNIQGRRMDSEGPNV